MPRFGRLLGVSSAAVTVEHRDARTLRLRSDGFLAGTLGVLVRSAKHPLQIGAPIELGAWSATPLELSPDGDGRPRAFDVRFHDGLDDPSLRWMTWRGRGLVAWTLPPVGGAAVLPAPDPGAMFSGGPEHEGP